MKTIQCEIPGDVVVGDAAAAEVWLPCPCHEKDYVVSNFGRVAKVKSHECRILYDLSHIDGCGNPDVVLEGTSYRVCVLVAIAFCGAKVSDVVSHKDKNRRNNHASNLLIGNDVAAKNVLRDEEELTKELVASEIMYHPTTGDFYRTSEVQSFGDTIGVSQHEKLTPCQVMMLHYKKERFVVYLFGLRVAAERLAFFLINERWPVNDVVHIDGNTMNNRRYNLKEHGAKEIQIKNAHINNEGVLHDKELGIWIAYDEADLGIKARKCLTESEAFRERDSIRKEAAFVRDFEAKHGFK